ncbi:AsmA family protein [Gillisia marina]|uniref:hypothetical protein n=1 Tax=Gillisia marina TaxID=1167637 RepID=UPI0002D8C612|nr:hypothetical protein [Gillisia marina]
MEKKYKILLYAFIGLIVLFGIAFFANNFAKHKIKEGIKKELVNSNVDYEDITVDLIGGSSKITNPKLKLGSANISSQEIRVIDLDYKEYFSTKKIVFDRIVFKKPRIHITKSDTLNKTKNENSKKEFEEDIKIRHLVIQDGYLKISDNDTVKDGLYVSLKNMDIYNLHITEESLKNKVPFNFSEVSINSDSLYYALDSEHDLHANKLKLKKSVLTISDLRILPKYSKTEFDKRQKIEHDRFELSIPQIKMKDFAWGFNGDKLHLESAKTSIENAEFHIYRNKLLPDDNSIKPLYSRKLREIGTKLKFDKIQIVNSSLSYEEKSVTGKPPGKVLFSDMDVTIQNVTNLNMESDNFPLTP